MKSGSAFDEQSASFLVQCWPNPDTELSQVRVVQIDQADGPAEVRLGHGAFLVRIAIDQGRVMERCFIRHIASGREAYVQGGPGLRAFIQECLLAGVTPAPARSTEAGE